MKLTVEKVPPPIVVDAQQGVIRPTTNGVPEGLRYSLPAPFLSFTPQPDGSSLAVDEVDLPDPNNTYAVSSSTVMASYTLTMKTSNGILEEVDFKPDNTAVAGQAVASASNLATTELGTITQSAKDLQQKSTDAKKAYDDISLTVDLDQNRVGRADQGVTDAQKDLSAGKAGAQAALDAAQAELRSAKAQLQDDTTKQAAALKIWKSLQSGATAKQLAPNAAMGHALAPAGAAGSPFFYRIVESPQGVYLEPVVAPQPKQRGVE